MKNYDLFSCKITDGFFAQRQQINAETTMQNVYARFYETGRFKALKCKNEEPHSHVFWDSDIAKWLEGAACLLSRKDDPQIRAWYNEAVEDILANQMENGYFNSYFQVYKPNEVFTRREDHELYCAGHLFEAAVTASKYLSDNRLLLFAEKYVNYIIERFMVKKDTAFVCCGHPEIELALCRLYEHTGKEKYIKLAAFFLDQRGQEQDRAQIEFKSDDYCQSHKPLREQTEARGHAVRALYTYTAMAKMARLTGDKALKTACKKLFENIISKKMYITGAIGSVHQGERLANAYELNNDHAYAETCASIAIALFAQEMFKLTGEVKYAHVIERVLYNGILSGVSIDGSSFFYVNPLEFSLERFTYNEAQGIRRDTLPIAERVKIFHCSCCPPNICRFFEQLPKYIWYADEEKNELVLSQYISSELQSPVANAKLVSGLPTDEKLAITLQSHGKNITLKVRKPEWCEKKFDNEKDGYLLFNGVFNDETITIEFPLLLKKVYANPLVHADVGKVALTFGPLVMCAEGLDNDFSIFTAHINNIKNAKIIKNDDTRYAITAKIPVLASKPSDALYSFTPPKKVKKTLILVPYFTWANRGKTDMLVWFSKI